MEQQILPKGLVFNFRDTDSPAGVSRESIRSLATKAGVTETQYIHTVLAQHVAAQHAVLDETYPDEVYLQERNRAFVLKHGDFIATSGMPGLLFE